MELIDAMIVWTPNREPFLNSPLCGKVAATMLPELRDTGGHALSIGACNSDWTGVTDDERQRLLQGCFNQMILEDGIKEEDARRALSAIDDINPLSLRLR